MSIAYTRSEGRPSSRAGGSEHGREVVEVDECDEVDEVVNAMAPGRPMLASKRV
jgi:hypothetical protein